jgi:hypothetical protein
MKISKEVLMNIYRHTPVVFLKSHCVIQVSIMKRLDFGDVLEIGKYFSGVKGHTHFSPKYIGYLTGHRLASMVPTKKSSDFLN